MLIPRIPRFSFSRWLAFMVDVSSDNMPSPKPTTDLLTQLRSLMQNSSYVNESIYAYIVPSKDAHNSEYLAECDKHREFISGFTGSAGTAIITLKEALLWTDGRYYLQASEELDSNWTLMKDGLSTTPTEANWLSNNIPTGSRVGVDPKLYTYRSFIPLQTTLETAGHKLVPIETNLVEIIWKDRPERPTNPVKPLDLEFSGKSVKDKLGDIVQEMNTKKAKYLVLTALDEIGWFLNLRGSDIVYNPVFFSYVLISSNGTFSVFLNPQQSSDEIKEHLTAETGNVFKIISYDLIEETLKEISKNLDGLVWFSETSSYGLVNIFVKKQLVLEVTPPQLMKAVKNPTEIQGMRNSHIKDAAALCCYFSWLENNVASGNITEVSGAEKLHEFRQHQEHFMDESFQTISAVGSHGAIIHYQPSASTDVPITNETLYLCDSGSQFKDGTTDVTRTFHFGTPTEWQKETYTRVLKGQIKLGSAVFPSKIKGNQLDSFAREFLWEVGLDYAHGTGHGIGMYLNVHEGPFGISYKLVQDDPGLEAGMFVSNEPGYYQEGQFGIRIEDIVQIVEANPPHNFSNKTFLTFETITLVPKQTKLINVDMLTDKEIEYLNKYHQECRDVVGPILEKQGHSEAKEWLWKETEPISR